MPAGEGLGGGQIPLILKQMTQVADTGQSLGMLGTQHALASFEHLLSDRLGAGVVAPGINDIGEAVQTVERVGVVLSHRAFLHFQIVPVKGLRSRQIAFALEQEITKV
jgi:hypothetical protein